MSGPAIVLVVDVKREQTLNTGAWVWTGLPRGYPGSAGGRTIAELHQEIESAKHFIADVDQTTEVAVEYVCERPTGPARLRSRRRPRLRGPGS